MICMHIMCDSIATKHQHVELGGGAMTFIINSCEDHLFPAGVWTPETEEGYIANLDPENHGLESGCKCREEGEDTLTHWAKSWLQNNPKDLLMDLASDPDFRDIVKASMEGAKGIDEEAALDLSAANMSESVAQWFEGITEGTTGMLFQFFEQLDPGAANMPETAEAIADTIYRRVVMVATYQLIDLLKTHVPYEEANALKAALELYASIMHKAYLKSTRDLLSAIHKVYVEVKKEGS